MGRNSRIEVVALVAALALVALPVLAGALNETTPVGGYNEWMGHTLGSTATPPGFNPAAVGLSPTWYDPTTGLECTSCHSQHGSPAAFRNLGPFSMGNTTPFRPTYVI